jgi:hypothetical protein
LVRHVKQREQLLLLHMWHACATSTYV